MSCCGGAWAPPNPSKMSCCMLKNYSPAPEAYCCDLYAQKVSEQLFPPPKLPDLNRMAYGCCMLKTQQRRPVSYQSYLARKEFGAW